VTAVPSTTAQPSATRAGVVTPVAWEPRREMAYTAWVATGRRLSRIVRCSQWWLGDWIRYGTANYGEKYTAAAKLTGYDVHSLRNMSYVASRFSEVSRRRDDLSWSHHAELAALSESEQDHWLERAVQERLSVADLRVELRASRRSGERSAGTDVTRQPVVCCPECGHRFTSLS
jgi:hypothetical protein